MTLIPHPARKRPSEPFWLVNESLFPPDAEHARRHASLMHIAGTSLAMGVIRNLLRCSEASRRTKRQSAELDAGQFSPTQVEGLRAALYFLRQYGDGLLEAERER